MLALAATASPSSAATIKVDESAGEPNQVELSYIADPGEDNRVSFTYTPIGGGLREIDLIDQGNVIRAGEGCSGGGMVSAPVRCIVHEPRWYASEFCGKNCSKAIPGTAWEGRMIVNLGDGDNSFDGSAISQTYNEAFRMTVFSGAGDDRITTGGGNDVINPGPGADVIQSGDGFDELIATASPDEADTYENPPSTVDLLSYAARTVPTFLEGSVAGAAGEHDILKGWINVIGGSGDDVLVGGPRTINIEGGPGDDIISGSSAKWNDLYGGPGDDVLSATGETDHLVGEDGNDIYRGGEGTDLIRDFERHLRGGGGSGEVPSSSGGNDTAYGGGGRDIFEMGSGSDTAFGGPGDDSFDGGAGPDVLVGGRGSDWMVGGFGFDRLYGGQGRDVIFSGRKTANVAHHEFPFPPTLDDGPDLVGCGPGRDAAAVNPWDTRRNCETVHLLRP